MSPLKSCCDYFNTNSLFHYGGIFSWICLFAKQENPKFYCSDKNFMGWDVTVLPWITQTWELDWRKGGEGWGWQRRREEKKKNLWRCFGLNEKDFLMFCCLPTASRSVFHTILGWWASAAPVITKLGLIGAPVRSRNVERVGKEENT